MNNYVNDKVKIEALLNEYKGNIFEYLVAHFLAKKFCVENYFLSCIETEYRQRLSFYERQLKKMASDLIPILQEQAVSLGENILSELPKDIDGIWVIGKANCQLDLGRWNEADIIAKSNNEVFPISIKLCKATSYINTKSGGISSFITKYFYGFEKSFELQEEFNRISEINFTTMRSKLFNEVGITEDCLDFSLWKKNGFPELSGSLPKNLQSIVIDSYAPLNDFLFNVLYSFYKENVNLFYERLGPILGLSGHDMIQAILFHTQNTSYSKQVEKKCVIFKLSDFVNEMESVVFRNSKDGKGYFYLDFETLSLQIRIKPMNKFTSKSYKINCSIKHSK